MWCNWYVPEECTYLTLPQILCMSFLPSQILYDGNRFYRGKAEFIKAIDTMGAGDSFCTAVLMSFLKAGWKKDRRMEADTIRETFAYAAKFAALNCQVEGSFGYGAVI